MCPSISRSPNWTLLQCDSERKPGNQSHAASVVRGMRSLCAVAGAVLFACQVAGFAETDTRCSQTFSATLQPRAVLVIDSRPAGLQIVGTDGETIHVSCTASNPDNVEHVTLRFSTTPNGGRLAIEGTHLHEGNNNLHVRIEVPRRTNLRVRMFAGEVKVEEIKGDKDVEIGAGQITISGIHERDYRTVSASVGVGEVNAPAFNANRGGFFRSVAKSTAAGEYRLHAHVTTGQIDLLGSPEPRGPASKPD